MIKIVTNGCVLGFGLAMDAFSVSLANGLNEPKMTKKRCLPYQALSEFSRA